MTIAGVLLAGGQSRRMGGGDKCLLQLGGKPILAHAIERARPQVAALALNANGDAARFAGFGLPVVPDGVAGFAGPLAGVLAGLDWAAASVAGVTHVASFATDAPFLPRDLVPRLLAALDGRHELAAAASRGRTHPVFGLWPLAIRDALRQALAAGVRKVDLFTQPYTLAVVDFPVGEVDPFFNTNDQDDLEAARTLVASAESAD
ncbi:MAG TPA: molybdenum cofactor guanylyltransferase MobA [Stellaceae bacterium]|nr:molybdenum cofactor guanylyltransferase MobA [Stellaceae bacterium]